MMTRGPGDFREVVDCDMATSNGGAVSRSDPEPAQEPSPAIQPTRLTGSAAFRLHLTLGTGLAICIGAFCIEVLRALGGNTLSWAYVFEWPVFAGFAIYMWWNLLNGWDRRRPPANDGAAAPGSAGPNQDEGHSGQLEAWRRYLRELDNAEGDEPTT
jgi:hypothetical protein